MVHVVNHIDEVAIKDSGIENYPRLGVLLPLDGRASFEVTSALSLGG